jgi:hypothetical protein
LPIILLPDLSKDYGSINLIKDLWNEFRSVLRRAKCVLVLGHSLNDFELLMALKEDIDDGRRIAVAWYSKTSERVWNDDDEVQLAFKLGHATSPTIVPINFGTPLQPTTFHALQDWQERVQSI